VKLCIEEIELDVTKLFFPRLIDTCRRLERPCPLPVGQQGLTLIGFWMTTKSGLDKMIMSSYEDHVCNMMQLLF